MSVSQLFDWPTAKAALNEGWRVRRDSWTDDRWLERWTGGLIWLILSDGTKRVVQNTDFGADEFIALDWTNLPTECVTSGTAAGTGTNGCPLPYSPQTPPAGSTHPPTPVDADQSPSAAPGAGQTGSGGGGGGGSGSNAPRHTPPSTVWPTLSLSINPDSTTCYSRSTFPNDTVNPTFIGTVSMDNPSNYSGPSFFFVSVNNGSNSVATCTLAPGGSSRFSWTDPLAVPPGSTLNFNARAWASGAPDLQATASAEVAPWCDQTETWNYPMTPSGEWRAYQAVTIATHTIANPFGKACSVTVSGGADDDIYIDNIGQYLKGVDYATGDWEPNGHNGKISLRDNVSFRIEANESVTLSLIDTVGINAGCNITVRFH